MKIQIYAAIAIVGTMFLSLDVSASGTGWKAVRGGHHDAVDGHRALESGTSYGLLYSRSVDANQRTLCVTAVNGASPGAQVGWRPCLFGGDATDNQLWDYTNDGQFRLKMNPNRCLTVASLTDENRRRAKLENCDRPNVANEFDFQAGSTPTKLKFQSDKTMCLAHSGTTLEPSDTVIGIPCGPGTRFFFGYERQVDDGSIGLVNDDSVGPGSCLVVEDNKPIPGALLLLGSCQNNHDWRYDEDDGLFRTTLNDNMCMQAGYPSATPEEGTWMRLFTCNKDNPNQRFDYDRISIKLRGNSDLCVGFQGATSDTGSGIIILKDCDKNGNNWSED